MVNIIISLDYEVYGEGSGSVKGHMTGPAERIFKICEKHGVPVTIMFEYCEYAKFVEFDGMIKSRVEYSPSELMKEQLKRAVAKGHDVQLHIHPQWSTAFYDNGKWSFRMMDENISSFTKDEIFAMLKKGKEELLYILKSVNEDYECNTVRFTGYKWAEAPVETHYPMHLLGIKAHSLSDRCPEGNRKGYWRLPGEFELYEIPIYSMALPKHRIFSPLRIAMGVYSHLVTRSPHLKKKIKSEIVSSGYGFPAGLFRDRYVQKWDLCKQTAGEMMYFLDEAFRRYDTSGAEVPLVMIGHTNNFFNDRSLDVFLRKASEKYLRDGRIRFTTFGEFVKRHIK